MLCLPHQTWYPHVGGWDQVIVQSFFVVDFVAFFCCKGVGGWGGGGSEERRTSGVISIPVMLVVLVVLEQRKNENELQGSGIYTETTAAAGDQIWKEVLIQIVELVMTVFHTQCNCAFRLCVAHLSCQSELDSPELEPPLVVELELEPDDDVGVDIFAWTGRTFLGVIVVLRGVSGAGQCRAVGAKSVFCEGLNHERHMVFKWAQKDGVCGIVSSWHTCMVLI